MANVFRRYVLMLAILAASVPIAQGSSVVLGAANAAPGATVSVPITFSAEGSQTSGLAWTLTYSTADFSAVQVLAGPVAIQEGKEVYCFAGAPGAVKCVLIGLNANTVADGVIATVSLAVAPSISSSTAQVGMTELSAATPVGDGLLISGSGAAIQVDLPVRLSGMSCAPSSVTVGNSATCTASLSAPAPAGGVTVALGWASGATVGVNMPSSSTIPAGSSSGAFQVQVASASGAATLSITGSLNGETRNCSIAVSTPAPVAVAVTPATATLSASQTRQFVASVTGTTNTAVTWSLSPQAGTIVNGLYTAPASITAAQTVTVRATSAADTTKYATAVVSLTPAPVAVTVTPATATLSASQTRQFVASVTGTTNTAVTWSLSPQVGTIVNGLYTAPASITAAQTVTVRATSAADTTKYATAAVSLLASAIDTTPPVISNAAAAPGSSSAAVSWTTNEPATCKVLYGTSASTLTQTISDPGLTTSATMNLSGLTADTTYYYRVVVADAAQNSTTWPAATAAPATFRTTSIVVPPVGAVMTVFAAGATPQKLDDGDPKSVELGLKFSSDAPGKVTGIRFFKGTSSNSGTHAGNLWTSTGQKLASVTFASETASGWQTAYFPSPVAIAANTTYVISYNAPKGHYSVTEQGLSSGVHNGPLHVPASGGVYRYGTGGFPSQSYNASNYWVDALITLDENVVMPSSVVVLTGSLKSGTAASLGSKDGKFFQVSSTTAAPYTAASSASMQGVPNTATSLAITYSGKCSRACSQTLSIWNFRTNSWVVQQTSSAGTAETMQSVPVTGTLADYVSGDAGSGEVRVSAGCSAGTGSLTLSADLLRISYR